VYTATLRVCPSVGAWVKSQHWSNVHVAGSGRWRTCWSCWLLSQTLGYLPGSHASTHWHST
jgi:hypothetical protein